MLIKAITPTETYVADASTMTLYNGNGEAIAHGFLRIIAVMFLKDIIAVEKSDYDGNCLYNWESRKAYA